MTFAEKLRALLDARPDLTVSELARRAGLDRVQVQRLLNGKRHRPALDTVIALAQALGVSLSEFDGIEPSQES